MTLTTWLDLIAPKLNRVWIGTWKPHFIEAPRTLYDHELVIFWKGQARVIIDGKEYLCEAGNYIIVPPGKTHMTISGDKIAHRYCFHFDWISQKVSPHRPPFTYAPAKVKVDKINLAPSFVPRKIFYGSVDLNSRLKLILPQFEQLWKSDLKENRLTCRALFLEILLRVLAEDIPINSSEKQNELASAIKNVLDQTEPSEETIRSVLIRLGYSYEHLTRLFKKQFGITPLRYILNRKMERAKELLLDPQAQVSRVAEQLGFTDPGYFSRLFRNMTGATPSAFAGKRRS